jgi:aminopeptidase N
MPPWDGGVIWSKDDLGNPWISVACQGVGASVWWPCKDHGLDEPDSGATVSIAVLANSVAVSNGNLKNVFQGDNYNTYQWDVKSPINSYNITMNIGKYNKFEDVYNGLNGPLKLEFWFLEQHVGQAKAHLLDETKEMLKTFEYWFGAYPFYNDGYKLIETPFLGMEHQSGIAYGNKFKKGYLGTDLSGSGWGMKWEYILVHESGHEWFGNNISVKDVADMWVHEGFTTYSEVLFVESRYGKKAADEYAKGLRKNIQNDKNIIGEYNINREGSGDMYFKGVQIIHMYRRILNNDSIFRELLHEMNRRYMHATTTTREVEALMQSYIPNTDLKPFFDMYLRNTVIPLLQIRWANAGLELRFSEVPKGFHMPVGFIVKDIRYCITVYDQWTKTGIKAPTNQRTVLPATDFYIRVQ